VIRFMDGKTDGVLKELRRDMESAAERMEFEHAAALRDRLRSAERVVEQQAVTTSQRGDFDVIGLARDETQACAQVFFMRGGRMVGRSHFVLQNPQGEAEPDLMRSFLLLFYADATQLPKQIVVSHAPEDGAALGEWLAETAGHRVDVRAAKRGDAFRLADLAVRNATETLQRVELERAAELQRTTGAMLELQEALALPTIPDRIECFDISHVQGAYTVASMSVFEQGKPKSSDYRRFRIRTVLDNNDFASMQEVLRRRFGHLLAASGVRLQHKNGHTELSVDDDVPSGATHEAGGWGEGPVEPGTGRGATREAGVWGEAPAKTEVLRWPKTFVFTPARATGSPSCARKTAAGRLLGFRCQA